MRDKQSVIKAKCDYATFLTFYKIEHGIASFALFSFSVATCHRMLLRMSRFISFASWKKYDVNTFCYSLWNKVPT